MLEVVLSKEAKSNPTKIAVFLKMLAKDLDECDNNLYPMRKKKYWDKMFSPKSIAPAEQMILQNDGVNFFLAVNQSVIYNNLKPMVLLHEKHSNIAFHMMMVGGILKELEQSRLTEDFAKNPYIPVAINYIDSSIEMVSKIKEGITFDENGEIPMETEFKLKEELLEQQKQLILLLSESNHLDVVNIIQEGEEAKESKRKERHGHKPLVHPGYNSKITDLIEEMKVKHKEDILALKDDIRTLSKMKNEIRILEKEISKMATLKTLSIIAIVAAVVSAAISAVGMIQ